MPRVKRAVHSQKKRRKVFKTAKGFRGGHGNLLRSAKEAIARALRYAYRDRRTRKREFRALWITRVNAAARLNGLSYSQLMFGLKKAASRSTEDPAISPSIDDAAFRSLADKKPGRAGVAEVFGNVGRQPSDQIERLRAEGLGPRLGEERERPFSRQGPIFGK